MFESVWFIEKRKGNLKQKTVMNLLLAAIRCYFVGYSVLVNSRALFPS